MLVLLLLVVRKHRIHTACLCGSLPERLVQITTQAYFVYILWWDRLNKCSVANHVGTYKHIYYTRWSFCCLLCLVSAHFIHHILRQYRPTPHHTYINTNTYILPLVLLLLAVSGQCTFRTTFCDNTDQTPLHI